MKFNWGHGIVLVMALAISGFLSLVFITSRERIDMVTEDYYPKELKYEDQIDKIKNYNALAGKIVVNVDQSVLILFPKDVGPADKVKGLIHFYRPSDKNLDIEEEISLNQSYSMSFPKEQFSEGKYELIIEWSVGEKSYLSKQDIYVD